MEQIFEVGDIVTLKKPHPCGSREWEILRVGADFRLKCQGCGRVVMLDRETFLKRKKALLSAGTGDTFPRQTDPDSPV